MPQYIVFFTNYKIQKDFKYLARLIYIILSQKHKIGNTVHRGTVIYTFS